MPDLTTQIAAQLAPARIMATGGNPLTEAALQLCAAEAFMLEHQVSETRQGIGNAAVRSERMESASQVYKAELKQRHLEGTLSPGNHSTPPARL